MGNEFTASLNLNTPESITGVDAIILFNPLTVNGIEVIDQHLLPETPQIDINNGNGVIVISQTAAYNQPYTGTGIMANIKFRAMVAGEQSLRIEYVAPGSTIDSNVVSSRTGKDILMQPQDLTFNVVDPAYLALQLTTPSENQTLGYSVNGIVSDSQSTWSAQIATDPSGNSNQVLLNDSFIGSVKTLLFKVQYFLRKRFNVDVQPGINTYDLGLLKAGDLNNDGEINNIDLSLMYDEWYPRPAVNADFNLDGRVNTLDHWILLSNFLQQDE